MPIPGYLLYQGTSAIMVSIVIISILAGTDWLDGIMARREGPTVLGGLLDPIADKIFIAVIYLPLSERYVDDWERSVIPLWITIVIFCRDFLVTSLRTSLSLRNAPMRTSLIAKFKTAIQMFGAAYVISLWAMYRNDPDSPLPIIVMAAPALVPLALIIYRLIKGIKQGLRSSTMLLLMLLTTLCQYLFGHNWTSLGILMTLTALTLFSGFSYLTDAWSALKGNPGSIKETARAILDGLLVPIALLLTMGRYDTPGMSTLIILSVTLELASGGLANLLADQKITPQFRWVALKSSLQVLFCSSSFIIWKFNLTPGLHIGEACIVAVALVTVIFSGASFWKHRAVYLSHI